MPCPAGFQSNNNKKVCEWPPSPTCGSNSEKQQKPVPVNNKAGETSVITVPIWVMLNDPILVFYYSNNVIFLRYVNIYNKINYL